MAGVGVAKTAKPSAMDLDIRIAHPGWDTISFGALAVRAVTTALEACEIDPENCEIAVLATGDSEIATLNQQFRDKPTATNVLSWPAQELLVETPGGTPVSPQADAFGDIALGDIAIAYETCAREAEAAGKPMPDHVTHLVVHGVLHLLGYDHVRDADATVMERREVAILGILGLDDPYRETAGA